MNTEKIFPKKGITIYQIMSLILLFISSISVYAQSSVKVAISEIPPCVNVHKDNNFSGFSVDLWKAIAKDLNIEYQIKSYTFGGKLEAVNSGEADIAIGCISISPGRESRFDFSVPVFNSGFQSVSLADDGLIPSFSEKSRNMLWVLLMLVILFAHIIWFAERGNDAINDRYFPGIFESIYFNVVTMSTVGYGDFTPKRWLGRISTMFIIMAGVASFGVILGQFTADALEENAKNPVESIDDLYKYRIATKSETSSAEFLKSRGLTVTEVENIEQAYRMLLDEKVDIVIYDLPSIKNFIVKNDNAIQTGPLFMPHYYGFLYKEENELKEKIDQSILNMREQGFYQTIYDKWF